jgi:hypothetical protein
MSTKKRWRDFFLLVLVVVVVLVLPGEESIRTSRVRREYDGETTRTRERALDYVLGTWSRGPVMSKMADACFARAETP